mmetsp:Transcript_12909/g.18637  ORF Transcript_12909/g.18637 Transcript_12909/m.18637 type:complete len:280 (+) Transcript_12909:994-1833(+)
MKWRWVKQRTNLSGKTCRFHSLVSVAGLTGLLTILRQRQHMKHRTHPKIVISSSLLGRQRREQRWKSDVKKDAIQAQHKKNEARSRERKAERNRRKKETKYRSIEEKRRRDKEEEEITFARMEIERWRTQQWEEWAVKEEERAILKVRKGNDQIDNSKIDRVDEKSSFLLPHSDNVPLNQHTNIPAQDPEEMKQMERNAARAAKAAAKRKKARQRKKEKKAALDAEKAKLAKDETIRKRKEASAMKCAACGDGMLDCGFEKFGVRFCSTKCARAGPRKN